MLKQHGVAYILGPKGSGKSTLATRLAKDDHDKGYPVFLNYPVIFDAVSNIYRKDGSIDSMTGEDIIEVFNANPNRYYGATVVLDEAQTVASSRNFFAASNKTLVDFIAMARKLKLTLLLVSQKFKKVDKWVREDAEMIIVMEAEYPEREDNVNFYMRIFDQNANTTKGFLHPDRCIWEGWFHGQGSFELFDTDTLIAYTQSQKAKKE